MLFNYNDKLIETKLLGSHNVMNILLAIETINELKKYGIKYSIDEIIKLINTIEPFEHRFKYHKINNLNIYDDSYNSNLIGFQNAVNVLKQSKNKKIIITPGIVEMGKDSKIVNNEIGNIIDNVFDEIILIKNKNTKYIIKGLVHTDYLVFDNFKEAYKYITEKYIEEIDLLIENDLPDLYL